MRESAGTLVREAQPASPTRRQRAWQRLHVAAPVLVVAVLLLLTARGQYFKHGYQGLVGFAAVGSVYGDTIGVRRGAVGTIGYDGQFYYYLALRPDLVVTCAETNTACPLDNLREMRVERILYPMTVRLLALGQPGLIPFALLLVNFLAILLTVWLVSRLCLAAGASRWLGAAAGLFTGEVLAFVRDLADPFAVMWLVLSVYLARTRRWYWSAAAVAAALLAREQLILMLPLLALPLIAQRRWPTLAICAAIALVPFAAWQVTLRVLYGAWALLNGDTHIAGLVPIPFVGLWQARSTDNFKELALSVAVPMVVALAIAVLALRRDGLRSLLTDPVPAMVLIYTLLMTLISRLQWVDIWGPGRLAAPGVVLAVVVATRVARPLCTTYALLLAAPTVLVLLTNLSFVFGAHPSVLR
ncbi:MAG TPA: hypothetical protein VGS80_15930 [Ktedonobacterales bacterium]|nr:hypothetical protein [Ktedonobacterales bacterium]